MAKLELLTMSTRELDRLKTIQAVADGNLRAVTAAAKLNLSRRQVDRLTERYRLQGALGLLSRKRGQVHHCLEPEFAAVALAIFASGIRLLVRRWPARSCGNSMALSLARKQCAS